MSNFNIRSILGAGSNDVRYEPSVPLNISLILRTDSYKFSHPFAYDDGIKGMTSYGAARISQRETVVVAGMQRLLKKYFTQRITADDIEQAEKFAVAHFGRALFDRAAWEKVVNVYNGYIPVIIRSVPEGTPIRGGQPIYTVTCLDEDIAWMSAGVETIIQRGIWYPTVIASMDRDIKQEMKRFYEISGADMNMLEFALHDFGGRGVSSGETAEIGGCAHMFNFRGSDTIEGIVTANHFYKEEMAGYSVYATEHAIQCSYGPSREDAVRYLTNQITKAPRGSIVSVVIDGYDTFREAEILCVDLKDLIVNSGVKVVFRPDSGDMLDIVPRILRMQEAAFGSVTNSKGYRKINNVGVIQGDGVDHMAIKTLLGNILASGFSADNVIFGSGGALLQKVNRDTQKFAQKACSVLRIIDGKEVWVGISKNPITDPGKKSLEGVLTLFRSNLTGEYTTGRLDQGEISSEFSDVHRLVYDCGVFYNETTLEEIRKRVAV